MTVKLVLGWADGVNWECGLARPKEEGEVADAVPGREERLRFLARRLFHEALKVCGGKRKRAL